MLELIRDIFALIGGMGVIVLGVIKLFGAIWQDRLKEEHRKRTELDIETHRQRLTSTRKQAERFAQSQYDVYIELWQTLQGLRLAVEALWAKANRSNIVAFAGQLREARFKVDNWSIFFNEAHLKELDKLLKVSENFEAGKTRLVSIRNSDDVPEYFENEIQKQIEQNRRYKEDIERLLEKMRISFRDQLSKPE